MSTEVLHFDPVSPHLPGEANWVRQMERKHERILIPFKGFDGEINLERLKGLPDVSAEISAVFIFGFLNFQNLRSRAIDIFFLLINYFSAHLNC